MGQREFLTEKLKEFKARAGGEIPLDKVIFFGSRAAGKPHKYSDIDLVIVSRKFGRMNFFDRVAKMYDYWTLDYPVDFLCFTPREFKQKEKQISIVRQAIKEGIEIE